MNDHNIFIFITVLTLVNIMTTGYGLIANACILHAAAKLYSERQKQGMISQLKREERNG